MIFFIFFIFIYLLEFYLTFDFGIFLFSYSLDFNAIINEFYFLLIIIFIIIIIYRNFYINNYLFYFFFYVLIFIFLISIIFYILSDGIHLLFLFWDILGIIRFILIIYYLNLDSIRRGVQTLLRNRNGDFLILILIILEIIVEDNYNIFSNISYYFIFWTRITKRAQFPFIGWLPKAISAPTPVRALVHRRTLVTAGVFLLYNFRFLNNRTVIYYIFIIGLIRIGFSSFIGIIETDIKKLIAWRTLSQIGICFISFRLRFIFYSFIHIISHAIFKRITFLQIGYLINKNEGEQEIRFLSLNINIIVKINLLIRIFSLIALFFLGGIITKDLILEIIFNKFNSFLFFIIFYLIFLLTFFYSIKLIKINFKINLNYFLNIKKNYIFIIVNYIYIIINFYFLYFYVCNFIIIIINEFLELYFWFIYLIIIFIIIKMIKIILNLILKDIFLIEIFFNYFLSFLYFFIFLEILIYNLINLFINLFINIRNKLYQKRYLILILYLFLIIFLLFL